MPSEEATLQKLIEKLTAKPVSLGRAQGSRGLPSVGGLYAWWTIPGSIPGVPECRHPKEELDLFYLGIAPKDSTSRATLRSRVVDNHINGNTGSSTFRKTLASLLFETSGWQPRMTDRPLLSRDDNAALRDWQHQHLRLTWAEHARPWIIEDQVINALKPPLNLAGNRSHPFWPKLSDARKGFMRAATFEPSDASASPNRATRAATERIKLHEENADICSRAGIVG